MDDSTKDQGYLTEIIIEGVSIKIKRYVLNQLLLASIKFENSYLS